MLPLIGVSPATLDSTEEYVSNGVGRVINTLKIEAMGANVFKITEIIFCMIHHARVM